MSERRRSRRSFRPPQDPDLARALDAMTADELRAFVRDALDRQDDEPRSALVDSLIARAAKGSSGWRPRGPSREIINEVERFAQAARRTGSADPIEMDGYLRQGTKAFLAGEHATARGVFEALLPSIAHGEIDLGQHEMLDEVLTVDAGECAAQYLVSVYLTTPLEGRAEALCRAIEAVHGVALLWSPLEQMERVATGPLLALDAFLPLWVEHIEREPSSETDWENDRDRWLREAVLRLEGVAGLERIARKTKKPGALEAWCRALTEREAWADALRAYDDAAELVGRSPWRGDFLDGAALAAQRLGRRDATGRLEAAWLGAPSLVRLLRWLGASHPRTTTLMRRAEMAIKHCPATAARQLGLLHLLTGDVHSAAGVLAKAAGLGWSSEDHPGHVLFPACANLLAGDTRAMLSAELFAGLAETPRNPLGMDLDGGDDRTPKLATPSIADLIVLARPGLNIGAKGRWVVLEAMRTAASRRVEGILSHQRRNHYSHAATLVACCLEVAPGVGKRKEVVDWVEDVRKKYSRFYAFQEKLMAALSSGLSGHEGPDDRASGPGP